MKQIVRALAIFLYIYSSPAFALEIDANDIRGESDKKSVKVLQDRFFKKALRPEFGLLFGNIRDEAYVKTYTHGLRFGLFFNEWVGLDLQYQTTTVKNSDDRTALNKMQYRKKDPLPGEENDLVSPDPEVNPVHKIADINFVGAPFYGKMNLMDAMIVYFDLYVTAGVSSIDTDQGKKTAFNIGVGERFYFTNSLSFRVDFRDRIFKEKRSGQDTTKKLISIDFGLSYFFL